MNELFQELCRNDNMIIFGKLGKNRIDIKIVLLISQNQSKEFRIKVDPLLGNQCNKNLQELLMLLKDINNIEFDIQKQILIIGSKDPFGKSIQLRSDINQKKQQSQSKQYLNQIFDKCNCKQDLSSQQIKQFFKNISHLYLSIHHKIQQNSSLQKQLREQKYLKINMEDKFNRYQEQIKDIRNKLNDNIQSIKSFVQDQFSQKIRNQLKKTQVHPQLAISDQFKNQIQRIQDKLIAISQDFQTRIQKISKRINEFQNSIKPNPIKQSTIAANYVDPICHDFKSILIFNNEIKNLINGCVYIFSRFTVKNKPISAFKFNYINHFVGLGIVDASYKKDSKIKENFFCFGSLGGCNVGFNKIVGQYTKGFSVGELVEVLVDIKIGNIQWRVCGQTRKKFQLCTIIKDQRIEWVPFVYLHRKDDSVSIME